MNGDAGIGGRPSRGAPGTSLLAAEALDAAAPGRSGNRLGEWLGDRVRPQTLLGGLLRDVWAMGALLLVGALVVVALFPDLVAPHPPVEMHMEHRFAEPSIEFPLGTDEFGRDLLSRISHGTTVAMAIAFSSMLMAVVLGVPLGLLAGWYGGLLDSLLMRVQDGLLAFPSILFAILAVALFGPSVLSISLVMVIVYVPRFARLTRANVLVLKQMEFVEASRAIGSRDSRILLRTVLPNCVPTLLVQLSLGLAFAILVEAGLSYLGLGVQPPQATWGSMLREAQRYTHQSPWYAFFPGAAIFGAVLLFNFLGDRLRDNLDPRLRRFRDA